MAPARSVASTRLAASARSARESNSNAERKERTHLQGEDERERERERERKKVGVNKQIIKNFGIVIRTVSYLRRYCSMFQIFETFRTLDEA